jgi:phosphoribosyl-dephospho-CoA transferase
MSSARPGSSSLVEVLDRILDKGVVIDVWARVSLVGIEILTVEARVVVASVDTFLHYAKEISKIERAEAQAENAGDMGSLQDIDIEQSESPNPRASPE